RALGEGPLPLFAAAGEEHGAELAVRLPRIAEGEQVVEDYSMLRLSLRTHPVALLRERLAPWRATTAAQLKDLPDGTRLTVAGLVLVRQRPGSASGVIFATIEDETGVANLVVWPKTFEAYRPVVLGARLLGATGRLQKEGIVIHVVTEKLFDLSHLLGDLSEIDSLQTAVFRADELKNPIPARRSQRRPASAPGEDADEFPHGRTIGSRQPALVPPVAPADRVKFPQRNFR
ncbi:MAG: OB-fold nucleic acid binding domain-containing protein, partial [Acetobacterales bacterium]